MVGGKQFSALGGFVTFGLRPTVLIDRLVVRDGVVLPRLFLLDEQVPHSLPAILVEDEPVATTGKNQALLD